MKAFLKDVFFNAMRKALNHNEGRRALLESLGGVIGASSVDLAVDPMEATPYEELPLRGTPSSKEPRNGVTFITGRFRSGSTLLWHLFRQLECCTSFYEPFNERRWFDDSICGTRVDESHRGVTDYWREYAGLTELGRLYCDDWTTRNLYMDACAWAPKMQAYVERLIELAPGRPILQFNRIDFRLPWFRRRFPDAQIVHIYRHPRDQWCSTLMDLNAFGPDSGNLDGFRKADRFYLRAWVRDLRYNFPFLADSSLHPYCHFYWIWKLSYLLGRKYADYSVCFEELVHDPVIQLQRLFVRLSIDPDSSKSLSGLVETPDLGRWRDYAEDEWFARHESHCDRVLVEFLNCATGEPTR